MIKVMVIANDEKTIFNFRMEILRALIQESFQVIVCYPWGEHADEIEELGCKLENLEVSRHGTNILQEWKLIHSCKNLIKKYQPDIVICIRDYESLLAADGNGKLF